MMKKLVIFDLDGTLLNTIADLAAATNIALRHYGFPEHEEKEYNLFVGNGINKLFERALPEEHRTEENIMKIRSQFVPYYDMHNADLSRPYCGVTDVLKELQNRGVKLAIASNKYQSATTKLVKEFFPEIEFSVVLGQREGVPSKPDPTIVNEISAATGISKEDIAYVGDSCVDMETGRNAGVETIGVSWGFRPRKELESYNPAFIVDNSNQLMEYLLK